MNLQKSSFEIVKKKEERQGGREIYQMKDSERERKVDSEKMEKSSCLISSLMWVYIIQTARGKKVCVCVCILALLQALSYSFTPSAFTLF